MTCARRGCPGARRADASTIRATPVEADGTRSLDLFDREHTLYLIEMRLLLVLVVFPSSINLLLRGASCHICVGLGAVFDQLLLFFLLPSLSPLVHYTGLA